MTPPAPKLRPPSDHREVLLPLVDVGSKRFEDMCCDLALEAFPGVVRATLKRTSGVPQFGVDVEGFDDRQHPAVLISAKCYKRVEAWELKAWIEDFTKHLDGHWKGKEVRDFVLAVTHEFNDDALNDAARSLVETLETKGITFHLWDAPTISRKLERNVHLVDRYFNSYWVDAISAGVGAPSRTGQAAPTALPAGVDYAELANQLQRAAGQFAAAGAGELDRFAAARLDEAIDTLRAGRPSALGAWLTDARQNEAVWSALTPQTRARALRAWAMLQLQRDDVPSAEALLDEADALHPAPDTGARALLARSVGTAAGALAELGEPTSPQTRELKAALQVDAGHPEDALTFLGEVSGEEVTAGVLRLRAIARFETGDRDAALADAASAHRRAPLEASTLFTLATVRFLSSFVAGVQGRFGDRPNPIHPSLFGDTAEARALLDLAVGDFDKLATTTEEPLRGAAEAWKLAGLLVHPDRQAEAATLARALSRRDVPDPVVVAWLLNFGYLRHRGRVKRVYHRELREGRGDPTMLVVLARLIVGRDHPERGVTLIRRHRDHFPGARGMLDAWSAQYGDADLPGPTGFAAAIRACVERDDPGPLVEHLASDRATVEDIASGCELLAEREDWPELDGLRERLLSIGNMRSVTLAAHAALRSGDDAGCLAVLRRAADRAEGGRLPRSLIYLRIRANRALGRHRPVVEDLIATRAEGGAEHVDGQLIDAYFQAGALAELGREAERALAADRLGPEQALHVASALRSHAPEVARRALATATKEGIPADAIGTVLSLAAVLGLRELQEQSIGAMIAQGDVGPHVIRFDDVDAVLEHVRTSTLRYREVFQGWLRGAIPAVVAMHSDAKSFARLFLAEPGERRNQLGDPFPMLLRSGSRRRPTPRPDGDRPTLGLDLSALLLAARLGMLDEVERGFSIRVPNATTVALIELEADLARVDEGVVEVCRRALDGRDRTIRTVDEPPAGATPLEVEGQPGELDCAVVARLLEQAFRAGHVDRDRLARDRERLGVPEEPGTAAVAVGRVSSHALVRLARLDMLEVASRGAPLYMSTSEADLCRRRLATEVHESAMRDAVVALRTRVAARLLEGTWTTLPLRPPEADQLPGRTPHHMRCLQEILGAIEANGISWIEDRWLSHHRLEKLLDVVDVVDLLHARGIVSSDRRAAILAALETAGYAFLPFDAAFLHKLVEAAPVVDGTLVETPALAGRRVRFAEATEHARHLDTTYVVDEQGAVAGEARHALHLQGLARDVLSRVWSATGASFVERVARSEWVWTCLRPGSAAGQDQSDVDRRRAFTATTVGHVLDLPLAESFASTTPTPEWGHDFMRWFYVAQVAPLFAADGLARDIVVEFVATAVAHLLSYEDDATSSGAEEDEAIVRRVTTVKVRGFLDLLPADLRDRLSSRQGIAERVGMVPVMVLRFGADREAPVGALAEAYVTMVTAGRESPASTTVTLADGGAATLSIDADAAPVPPATLSIDLNRFDLPDHIVGLLHPDEGARRAALLGVGHLTDPRGIVRADDLAAIAALVDPEPRFAAFDRLLAGDRFLTLSALEQRIRSRDGVRMTDLEPPSPEALRAYLGLPDLGSITSGEDVAAGAAALVATLGPAEAADRLAGLPVDLPSAVVGELARHMTPRAESDGRATSPLSSLLRVRAMLAAGAERGDVAAGVRSLVDALRDGGGLFVALVRDGALRTLRDEAWRALRPQASVPLLWSHADALTRVLTGAGMDVRGLTSWVAARARFDLATYEAVRVVPRWAARLTVELDEQTFVTSVVACLLAERGTDGLEAEAETLLRDACGSDGPAGLSPPMATVVPPPPAPTGFWATRDAVDTWVAAGWTSADHPFADRDVRAIVERVLAVPDDAARRRLLPGLATVIVRRGADLDLSGRLRDTLAALDVEATVEPDHPDAFHALTARALVLARLDDRPGMVEVVSRQAARCAERWPDMRVGFEPARSDQGTAFRMLARAALTHALELPGGLDDRMAAHADLMATIARAWPDARRAVVGSLDSTVRGLDPAAAERLWPTLMSLRAQP